MLQFVDQSKSSPTDAAAPTAVRSRFPVWLMAVLLGLATLALYWPATSHKFIGLDDDIYVTANLHVQRGLTWENVKWAFVSPVCANWHPLTMLSHMLDCQLFGLEPWGHHLTSVLLYALNTVLVFLLLRGLTGAFWRSALVAILFGWHPLHVESVAWVAERKDVLSAFFGLLVLIFYGRYAQRRSSFESGEPTTKPMPAIVLRPLMLDYGLALLFFVLGLMSKPMLVTWPFVMLLLDYWPLGRFKPSTIWRLVREKIPFFALAAMSSVVTYMVQRQGGAMWTVENLPLAARGANALISYCRYLEKLCWPTDLAVFYPYPGHWPLAEVVLAGGLILALSVLFFTLRRRYPFMLMGWLWFVGTMVPVIGLVQVGEQAMADRYSYLPSVGWFILVIWGAYELTLRWRHQGVVSLAAGSATIVVCLVLTRLQLGYWRNSETLFRHALAVTKNNYAAYNDLGTALFKQGQLNAAIREFQEAIRLKPDFAYAHYNLGVAFGQKGEVDQAMRQYQETIRLKPDLAIVHNNLGSVLATKGQLDAAIREFQEAIRLNPDLVEGHNNLGNALLNQGQINAAIGEFQEAIRLNPNYAQAHNNLGSALGTKGQLDAAIRQFQEAIRLNPSYVQARNNLNHALALKNAPSSR